MIRLCVWYCRANSFSDFGTLLANGSITKGNPYDNSTLPDYWARRARQVCFDSVSSFRFHVSKFIIQCQQLLTNVSSPCVLLNYVNRICIPVYVRTRVYVCVSVCVSCVCSQPITMSCNTRTLLGSHYRVFVCSFSSTTQFCILLTPMDM